VNSRGSLCVYTSTLLHNALKNKGKPTCMARSKDDYPVNIGKLKIKKVPKVSPSCKHQITFNDPRKRSSLSKSKCKHQRGKTIRRQAKKIPDCIQNIGDDQSRTNDMQQPSTKINSFEVAKQIRK